MKTSIQIAAALAAAASFAGVADAQRGGGREPANNPSITLFEHPEYQGRSIRIDGDAPDLRWVDFNDMTSSIRIEGGQWEVCLEPDFGGTCQVLDESLPNMSEWAFNERITSIQAIHRPRRDRREGITLWSGPGYTGRSVNIVRLEDELSRYGFNDVARSIEVHSGAWTLCEHSGFSGRCVELDRDSADLTLFRMQSRLSSVSPDGIPNLEPEPEPWHEPVPGRRPGFDDGFQPGGIRVTGGVRGVSGVFFPEPRVNGAHVERCLTRAGRNCDQTAADTLCREAGLSRSVWFEVEPRGGEYYYVAEGRIAPGRAALIDVMCVR